MFPGIFLGPTGNLQGTHKVFNINTGAIKKPCTITPFPMPDWFIKVVKDWGRRNQWEERSSTLKFLNANDSALIGTTTTLQTTKTSSKPMHPTPTSPPNSLASTLNQNSANPTMSWKSSKRVKTNASTLHAAMPLLTTYPA
jgi:hypothetical protein